MLLLLALFNTGKGIQKKSKFFSGQSTKTLSPPPLGLVAKRTITKIKCSFILSAQPLTSSPLPLVVKRTATNKKKKI